MQVRLKVLWLKNFLGFAIDQRTSHNSSPLTPYYFWPKTDAWDQLRLELDSKLWIKRDESIAILNTITEVTNYWTQDRNKANPKKKVVEC